MAIYGKSFSGTPEDAALFHPWIASKLPCPRGMPIGLCMRTGRVVYFDPWLLKDMGLITGLIFLMLGVRGSGKTSLLIQLITELCETA